MIKEVLSPIKYLRLARETGSFAVHGAQETTDLLAKIVLEVLARSGGEQIPKPEAVAPDTEGVATGEILEATVLTPQPPPAQR